MRTFVCLLVVCLPLALVGQTAEKIVTISEWTDADNAAAHAGPPATPATFNLVPVTPEGPVGKVWVRYDGRGLILWGQASLTETDTTHTVLQKPDVLGSEHVEIWLAAEDDVKMPPIGWNAVEGPSPVFLTKEDDCAEKAPEMEDCAQWYRQQVEYRAQFRRLFVHQWLAAPSSVSSTGAMLFEEYATSAFAALKSTLYSSYLPRELEPKGAEHKKNEFPAGQVEVDMHEGKDGMLEFHAAIPYEDFPPARQLDLHDLRLMVDVFNAAPEGKKFGGYSTTSQNRKWGVPATFNHIRLATPGRYLLSPCGYPPATSAEERSVNSWYQPVVRSSQFTKPVPLSTSFVLENPGSDWLSAGPEGDSVPNAVSPEVKTEKYFWKQTKMAHLFAVPN